MKVALPCAWSVFAWLTEATANKTFKKCTAHLPAAKWFPANVTKDAPILPIDTEFIPNRNGMSVYTISSHIAQKNIRRSTTNRTCCKQGNNKVLNDYHLHTMSNHTRKRYSFFTILICICIHLDTQLKSALNRNYTYSFDVLLNSFRNLTYRRFENYTIHYILLLQYRIWYRPNPSHFSYLKAPICWFIRLLSKTTRTITVSHHSISSNPEKSGSST